jgi:ABC-type siderophore export system fused ATPase/permease subunit
MALFGSLQGPMTQLPGQVFALIHGECISLSRIFTANFIHIAYVSMQRIEKFLAEEEVPSWATSLQKHDPMEHADVIGFNHASFSWSRSSATRFTLGPLNISFPRGKLSLVCGGTSSGKTALLSSLLGG